MTLLTLASRQIWPQVLAVLHTRPQHIVLFHSTENAESAGPARRLCEFFRSGAVQPVPTVDLQQVPHDRFNEIVDSIATVAEQRALDDTNCQMNLTGGNKLMAIAAAEWCRLAGIPFFYLERNLRVLPFTPKGADLLPLPEFSLDPHLARELDPLALLRCQVDAADITHPGQRLTLNERGRRLPEVEIQNLLNQDTDFRTFLTWDAPETGSRPGFALEYAAAAALLRLGVPSVQRSVSLAPKTLRGGGRDEGELDLVFNWSGRLWVVDCKDRNSAEFRTDALRTEVLKQVTPDRRLNEILDRLEDEFRHRDLHPLKEDLLAVAEVGGLLGRALCIRRTPLPPQAAEFARSRNIAVVQKHSLIQGLREHLFPGTPTRLPQLQALASARHEPGRSSTGPTR